MNEKATSREEEFDKDRARIQQRLRSGIKAARGGYEGIWDVSAQNIYARSKRSLALIIGSTVPSFTYSPVVGMSALFGGLMDAALNQRNALRHSKTMHTPEEYCRMQLFSPEAKKALVLVVPEFDGDTEELVLDYEKARSTATLLQDVEPDEVVVPNGVLPKRFHGHTDLADTLYPGADYERIWTPFSDGEQCRVLSPDEFRELTEMLDSEPYALQWTRMRQIVIDRFPFMEIGEDEESLVRLRGYIDRYAENLPTAYSESQVDAHGRRFPGKVVKQLTYSVETNRADQFELVGRDDVFRIAERRCLSEEADVYLSDTSEYSSDAVDPLVVLTATHMTLRDHLSRRNQSHISEESDGQFYPVRFIELEKSHPDNKSTNRKRFIAELAFRLLMGSTVAVGADEAINQASSEQPAASSGVGDALYEAGNEWRVEPHGLSPDGFYADNIFYNLDTETWQWNSPAPVEGEKAFSENLSSDNTPYMTLSYVTSGELGVNLPILEGTEIAALRVQGADEEPVEYSVLYSADGMHQLQLEQDEHVVVAYDLVETSESWRAVMPLHIDGEPEHVMEEELQLDNETLQASLEADDPWEGFSENYLRIRGYEYSNLGSELPKIEDAANISEFINIVYDKEKANCNIAATQISLLGAALYDMDMRWGYARGHNQYVGDEDGGYLAISHARSVTELGTLDATPSLPEGVSAAEVGLPELTTEQLERDWQERMEAVHKKEFPLLPAMLGISAVAIAVEVGAKIRVGQKIRQAKPIRRTRQKYHELVAGEVSQADLAQFMGWLQHAPPQSPAPEFGLLNQNDVSMDNVGDEALEAVAAGDIPGNVPQADSLRHAAAAELLRRRIET